MSHCTDNLWSPSVLLCDHNDIHSVRLRLAGTLEHAWAMHRFCRVLWSMQMHIL